MARSRLNESCTNIVSLVMKKILANLVLNKIFVTDKTAACFALGGYLRNRGRILLQCKIECCSVNDCNTQIPTLSQDAVNVFSPNGNGTFNRMTFTHKKYATRYQSDHAFIHLFFLSLFILFALSLFCWHRQVILNRIIIMKANYFVSNRTLSLPALKDRPHHQDLIPLLFSSFVGFSFKTSLSQKEETWRLND